MLATMLLVAATQTATPNVTNVQPSYSVSASHDLDAHKRHVLHMAHLRYLHWQHVREEAADRQVQSAPYATVTAHSVKPGVFTCRELQSLWHAAGGNPSAAFIASEIAMAESGGRSNATGPYGERGLWQINTDHGSLSTYDPLGNARAAVLISHNGSDWYPWTTYTSGAYVGRCLRSCGFTSTAARGACLVVFDPLPFTVCRPLRDGAAPPACPACAPLLRCGWFTWHLTTSMFRASPRQLTRCRNR